MWYSFGSCDNLVLIENNGLISAGLTPAAFTKESIMPPIRNDWAKVLAPEYNKPYYRKLFDFYREGIQHSHDLSTWRWYLQRISSDTVKGCKMCHHRSGSLSRSRTGTRTFVLCKAGRRYPAITDQYLQRIARWCRLLYSKQRVSCQMGRAGGFLLLNADFDCTCPSGCLPSGNGLGRIYRRGNPRRQQAKSTNRIFVVGSFAQKKAAMLDNPNHLILKAPHPSPLSAYRGFFGCKHFSQANEFLQRHGVAPIDWQIENI